ncbi:MAG: hypothetical protein A3H35_10030 [Betaproteobacteria bacterium RIFCSPLOWO2_02_FULL_62_17]|nr:MAG: hypothetical protein A3H35_10030 [Betaproteobacteria bacterium RIFCSPLOWO2_02_FULL_62_17]
MKTNIFLALSVALAGLWMAMPPAQAQGQKPGRIVIGVPPGASFDTTARMLADRMSRTGSQPFIVENRPGAGQAIAAEAVARSPGDGLTLFLSPIGPMVAEPQLNKQNVRYDSFKDFVPISLIATQELALTAGPALPIASLKEYLAAVKADSAKGFYTTPGANSLPHFFGMLIGSRAGLQMTHVPYQGPAPAIQAVMGGQVPGMIVGFPDVIAFHRAGKVKILATSGNTRMPMTPDVPTFVEMGLPIQLSVWYGVFGAGTTPPDVAGRTNKLVVDATRSKEMAEYLVQSGHRVIASTQQELADTLKRDFDYWGNFIRDSGIKVQ